MRPAGGVAALVVRTRVVLAVTVAALLVAGCSGDSGGGGGATTTTTPGTVTTVTTVPGGTTVPASTSTTAPVGAALVLRPGGVGPVDFGTSKIDTISALRDVLGTIDETGAGCEPAGPTANFIRWKELRLQFLADKFDSYNVRPPNGEAPVLGLRTEAGIGLGSTVADAQAAYGSQLTIPGLPPDFGGDTFAIAFPGTDRQLYGTLSDTSDTGTVTAILTQVCE